MKKIKEECMFKTYGSCCKLQTSKVVTDSHRIGYNNTFDIIYDMCMGESVCPIYHIIKTMKEKK